jgi:hypothetical protein
VNGLGSLEAEMCERVVLQCNRMQHCVVWKVFTDFGCNVMLPSLGLKSI